MLVNYGFFRLYTPDFAALPAGHMFHVWRRIGALYLRNERGVDWYAIAHAPENKPRPCRRFIMVHPGGRVASVGDDAESMWPIDCYFLATDAAIAIGDYFESAEEVPLPMRPAAYCALAAATAS